MEINIPVPDCNIAYVTPGHVEFLSTPVNQKQEGKDPMKNIATNTAITVAQTSVEATQRDYLVSRVRKIHNDLYRGLREQFAVDGVQPPQTAAELIDVIKNDKFTLDQKKIDDAKMADELRWFNSFYGIIWTDGKTKDVDGFKAAEKSLEIATQDVIDAVSLVPIDEAYKALETFKSWTYVAPAPAA